MHTFYDKMIDRISTENITFSISFEKRMLCIDGRKSGVPENEFLDWTIDEIVDEMLYLFDGYYRSVPSERTERKHRNYFVALPLSRLTDDDIEHGLLREQARFALELFVLMNIVNGKLKELPFRDDKAFFWQPKENHPFIFYRSWIEDKPLTAPE